MSLIEENQKSVRNQLRQILEQISCAQNTEQPVEKNKITFEVVQSKNFMEQGENITVFIPRKGSAASLHRHNYIELNYVFCGMFRQMIEGNEVISRKGDICIMDTMAAHSIKDMIGNGILVNILMNTEFFDTAFLSRLSDQGSVTTFLLEAVLKNRKKEHYIYFPSHTNEKVSYIMESILIEFFEKNIGYKEVWSSYMVILFTELLRTMKEESEKIEVKEQRNILDILSYIEKNHKSCTLCEAAKNFGLNPNYLTTLLRKKTGKSFLQHVHRQRMEQARYYLKNSDIAISEIVGLCGYTNLNFFYKLFKEEEKMTPADYRKQHKLKNG